MRILITGGSGYLGRRLVRQAAEQFEIRYTYFNNDPQSQSYGVRVDLRHDKELRDLVEKFRPQVIVHAAASDRSPDSNNLIRSAAENVKSAAGVVSARLIHLSTDVLFDGRRAPYDERAQPAPLHDYGRAKAAAEVIVREHANHVIVRTSLIYGLGEMDHATTGLVNALQAGKSITLFTDQRRNPIWVETLAQACLELAGNRFTGVLNVAGRQVLTRAEYGLRMLDWWNIKERSTLGFGPSDGDKWPRNCELDLAKATSTLRTPLRGLDEVLHKNSKTAGSDTIRLNS
jgi:dTDP-4-dehydrorhamnose reductase